MTAAKGKIVKLWASFTVLIVYVTIIFMPLLLKLSYNTGLGVRSLLPAKSFGVMSGFSVLALVAVGVTVHLVILCNMFFVILSGRTKHFLPRRPTTLASQILHLCRSDRLLEDFKGTSTVRS